MAGFDFATTDSTANDLNNDATPEAEGDEEVDIDFEANEVGELYLAAKEAEWTLRMMLNEMNIERLKLNWGDNDHTLQDVVPLLKKYSDENPMAKLHMVYALFKATVGKMQTGKDEAMDGNDHSIGFDTDNPGKAPTEHPEGRASFALFVKDLPSLTWETLDGGEVSNLEEMGVDVASLSFDTTSPSPKMLIVNGRRLPIAVEDGTEVQDALEILSELPNIPSGYTEDGFRESSDPSVFGETTEEADSDKGGDSTADEEVDYWSNPELIGEVSAGDIRSGPRSVSHVTSRRTLRKMLQVEENGKERSTVMKRLKERISAETGTDADDDEGASEAEVEKSVEEAEEDDSKDDEKTVEEVATLFDLSEMETDAVRYRVKSGKAATPYEAAKQVADI